MSQTFIYADPHYWHHNIIKLEDRPFTSTEEMNKTMIERHNSIIRKNDRVYILGDFCLSNKEKTTEIVKQLNGYKILIMGNHDRERTRSWWLDTGFDEVHKDPIIIKGFFILSHEPMYINDHMPYINIHGHLHSQKLAGDGYINVGVENTLYYPLDLEILLNDTKEKTVNLDM